MLKYGWNDMEWDEIVEKHPSGTPFSTAILNFNTKGYSSIMKRKTISENEKILFNALKEMVNLIDEHLEEIEKRG